MKFSKLLTRAFPIVAFAMAIFALALPMFALAAGEAEIAGHASEAEASGSNMQLLIPNLWEFIPMLVAFIILWVVFAKFALPPLMGILDKRTKVITDDLKSAEDAKIEAERVLVEHKAQLDDAKRQASEIVADAKVTAEAVKAQITEQANNDAQQLIRKAEEAIEAEKKVAIAALQASAADLTVSVAGKLIGSDMSDEEHKRIIERYVNEAGSLNVI